MSRHGERGGAGGTTAVTRQAPAPAAPPGGEGVAGGTRGGPGTGSDAAPAACLQGFHPGWFGAVMGTAIVGVAASLNPGGIASLAPAARALSQAMVVLAAVLAVPYAGRWIVHRDAALN